MGRTTLILKSLGGFPALILGIALIILGMVLLEGVGELRDRTEQTVATVEAGELRFTTLAGVDYAFGLPDTCKRAEPPPRRGCLERYLDGDEVLVWYDNAQPTYTWEGSTPGGGRATGSLYAGIVLVVWAVVTMYVTYVLPQLRVATARVRDIARRGPRPNA
jgi:hypothetical protein